MFIHPPLLLRSAQPHPQHIWMGLLYLLSDFSFLDLSERTVRRRVGPCDANAEALVKLTRQILRHPRRTPIEKVTISRTSLFAESDHEFRPGTSLANR